ncbi:MAG TPA: phosphodiesterase [Planctomycetaceae bacterium]|nr:phosphodiesterase [Planctomycetaceae bacterium]
MNLRILLPITIALIALADDNVSQADDVPLSRIAFGSCVRQDLPQPIWDTIADNDPELFIFLGDNIYGDTEDMDLLRAKYKMLADQPGLQKLKAKSQILGTWDDHDYGANDAGSEYAKKRESQQIFLDFFDVPADSSRRNREGVYHSQVFGPVGKRVQVILLDARYHRSALKTEYKPSERNEGYRGKYSPNNDPDATVLGEEQWQWLAEQLKAPAELRLICSGVQVLADEHGSEMWGNFPRERERLLSLLRQSGTGGAVLLSGDRHLSEIARLNVEHPKSIGYPLFDITSSSLNHPSGNFTKAGTRFANEINSYRVGLTYFEVNFGMIQIDWDQADPVVRMQVRDAAGDVVMQQRVSLSQLQPKSNIQDQKPRTAERN